MKKSTVAVLAMAAVLFGTWAVVAKSTADVGAPSYAPPSVRTASQAKGS